MSFIEKNKVWLLPLLGLGVLGVAYMNFRTFQGDTPAAEVPAQPEAEQAAPGPAAPEPAAPGSSPAQGEVGQLEDIEGQADLWSDLKPFAVLPGNLAQETVVRDRARVAMGPELGVEPGLDLGKPSWSSLAPPASTTAGTGTGPTSAEGGLPELDFLIHGPRGSFAWFGGRAYQAGEKLWSSSYTVRRIGPTFVELTGPQGRVVESTHPIHEDVQNPVEAP